ncbi:flagellar basal body-associated FliL family protein [Rhodovulum iodosum]|nr:flagellar basal body-associated FliL family protein [Rhodovulum robiginosum]
MLRPAPAADTAETPAGADAHDAVPHGTSTGAAGNGATGASDYVKLNNQFVVPVLSDGRVASLVVMGVSLEMPPGERETVYAQEPKLRDGFLAVLFDHANSGGFDGAFTETRRVERLRAALLEVARRVLGAHVRGVLIVDMVRQDS